MTRIVRNQLSMLAWRLRLRYSRSIFPRRPSEEEESFYKAAEARGINARPLAPLDLRRRWHIFQCARAARRSS